MKKSIFLCLIFAVCIIKAGATEWYGYYCEFSNFKYRALQLLGSEPDVPDVFPVAVQLNDYVRQLQQSGKLKNKPVVYDIYTTIYMESDERRGKKRYLLEVYETEREYRINANYREHYVLTFSRQELVRIIDYFASNRFETYLCDTTMGRPQLAKKLLMNRIAEADPPTCFEEKAEYKVYATGAWNVKMVGDSFFVYHNGKRIDAELRQPIVEPVLMNDRLIVLSNDRFSVFEHMRCIKSQEVPWILTNEQDISNSNSRITVYPQWLNIAYGSRITYSYSYAKNRFYDLNR